MRYGGEWGAVQSRRHRRHIRVASDLEFEMEGRWERRREGRKRGERKGGTPVWELGMLGMAEWLGTRDGELEVVVGTHSLCLGSL
jgi:hypothetical protein